MSDALKSYAPPWNGRLILACKKCQKKLKAHSEHKALAKLKKSIDKSERHIHVLNVPCLDVCPKDGVAVIDPDRSGGKLYILRGKEDVSALIEALSRP